MGSDVPRIETSRRPHTERQDIVLCGILYRHDTCDPALHVFCEFFAPFNEHLDWVACMARGVGHETLPVDDNACAVCTLAIFAVEYTGAGGGVFFAVEWVEGVVRRSEEGECRDGNVYPEVAGHGGGGGGGGAKRGREGH